MWRGMIVAYRSIYLGGLKKNPNPVRHEYQCPNRDMRNALIDRK